MGDQDTIVLCLHAFDGGMGTFLHFKRPVDRAEENIVWESTIKTVGIY